VPRYYFDVQVGNVHHIDDDDEDEVLDGPEVAFSEAVGLLSELVQQASPNGRERALTSTVRDEAGTGVYEATLTLTGTRLL
jgi:hypothetical protein